MWLSLPDIDLKLGTEYVLKDNIIFKIELGKVYSLVFLEFFNVVEIGTSFKI